jgi:hypothetical protein
MARARRVLWALALVALLGFAGLVVVARADTPSEVRGVPRARATNRQRC